MRFGHCARLLRAVSVVLFLASTLSFATVLDLSKLPKVRTHDNTVSAGELKDGVLTVHLTLKEGAWHPDAEEGAAIPVLAIAEENGPPSVPGPMIRVAEGTRIHVVFKNSQFFDVYLHGFHQRPGDAKDAVKVGPMETKELDFVAGAPGTYFYRASCFGAIPVDAQSPVDTTMAGAFIVDGPGGKSDDRVLVINHWYTWLVPFDFEHGFHEILAVNGKAWPHSSRLSYTVGETVRWRVINTTVIPHPMHLHGAHFRVLSYGNAEKDAIYSPEQQRMEVTQLMQPGETMALTWTPTHAGNWIFHCHLAVHFDARLANSAAEVSGMAMDEHSGHMQHDPSGMAGLIVGVQVSPKPGVTEAKAKPAERRLTLTIAKNPPLEGTTRRCINVELKDGATVTATARGSELGPTIVVYKNQPTEITVINKLENPTAIHWHGIELESYYDGVPGWGGDSRQVTPPIAAGDTFIAHMTPPRAGTYIYHTHWHDVDQLTTGLYGALIVLEPGQKYDPEHDRVFLVSRAGNNAFTSPLLVNGWASPMPAQLRVGESYRFRFINITPSDDGVVFSLLDQGKPAMWQPLAKDGADLPDFYRKSSPARQQFAAGETYDYVFQPTKAGKLQLDTSYTTLRTVQTIDVVEAASLSAIK